MNSPQWLKLLRWRWDYLSKIIVSFGISQFCPVSFRWSVHLCLKASFKSFLTSVLEPCPEHQLKLILYPHPGEWSACGQSLLGMVMSYKLFLFRSGLTATQLNIYDNPPKLPADVLQSLLADARRSIMGSATPTMGGASSRSDSECATLLPIIFITII